jgi:DNA-binding LytR/AlgR family response regulator
MKIKIEIEPNIDEPTIVIHTEKLSEEITALVELIEGLGAKSFVVVAKREDKSYVIEQAQIEIIRTEGGTITLYNGEGQDFVVSKPLHELQERLGNNFIRISKSTIVNINHVDHISPHFNGTMYIVMKNGISDYISRKNLSRFKEMLGL